MSTDSALGMSIKSISNEGLAVVKFNYSLNITNLTLVNDTVFDIYIEQLANKEEGLKSTND